MSDSSFPTSQTAALRTALAALIGLVAAVIAGVLGSWAYAPAIGWDVAAASFLVWTWLAVLQLDPGQTAQHATSEDPTKEMSKVTILAAAVASIGGAGLLLVEANSSDGTAERAGIAAFGVLTIALSWFVVHTLFMLRYGSLYYSAPEGGIEFNDSGPPRYSDFAYLALTIGMTFQVSDTNLKTHALRMSALRHALLSYLFGALILATSVNLVSSLASGGGR